MLLPGTLGTHSDFEVGIVFQDVRLIRKLANIATNGGRAVPSNVLRCGRLRYRIVRDEVNYLLGSKRRCVSSAPHPVGFESRHIGNKKPATELVTGFSDSVVPPAGCPRAAGAARFRCVASLLACCAGKRFAFPQLRTLSGSNPGVWVAKKPVTAGVTGFSV